MSIELLSVVLGGLALPQAERIRSWMRGRLAIRAVRWFYGSQDVDVGIPYRNFQVIVLLFVFMAPLILAIFITGWFFEDPSAIEWILYILYAVSIPAALVLLFGALAFLAWLAKAGDEALRNVLLLMGTLFGLGIALQLVAAIIGC
jgi:hypothetical protein